jgi:hypothetical protein
MFVRFTIAPSSKASGVQFTRPAAGKVKLQRLVSKDRATANLGRK